MSELDATLLARHARLLLRFYPKGYRAHRGEEIFDTLLETTRPGRGWPPPREVASVISGGLRARRAANLSQGLRASLRHVAILAAAMLLVQEPAASLFQLVQPIADPFQAHYRAVLELGLALESLFVFTALAATWCGRRWLVAVAGIAAVLADLACYRVHYTWTGSAASQLPTVLALVILLPLTKRAERPPVSLLGLPGLTCLASLAVNGVPGFAAALAPRISLFRTVDLTSPYIITYLALVPVLVAVCWLITDVRPLAAITLQFLLWRVIFFVLWEVMLDGSYPSQTSIASVAGLSLAFLCALVWLLRHRVRTAPPTTW